METTKKKEKIYTETVGTYRYLFFMKNSKKNTQYYAAQVTWVGWFCRGRWVQPIHTSCPKHT